VKKKSKYNVAVVGVRGAVGGEMIKILSERRFPADELRLFGSARSKGETVSFGTSTLAIRELEFRADEFQGIDLVLSSPGSSVSKRFVPQAVNAGAIVIDNTSAFRMDPSVPLVVPEINSEDIGWHRGVISNPNCSAIMMLMVVAPLHRECTVRRIVCATYQSTSGAGLRAMRELEAQSRDVLASKPIKKEVFPHQIAFNLFSHNSPVLTNGYNEEEIKMIQESRKILHEDGLSIVTTCVRVPVFRAHSEALVLEFEKNLSPENARKILARAPGVKIVDDREKNYFPMPVESTGQDDVLVGRIREDLSRPNGLALFISCDQLRKGAALNAIQIAEHLIHKST